MLASGSIIGIMGGGQLGRMLACAAFELGYRAHVFSPQADAPACQVTPLVTVAPYNDHAALRQFAQAVDVVTVEFEHIPLASLQMVAQHVPLHPKPQIVGIAQHRIKEKAAFAALDIPTNHSWKLEEAADLAQDIHGNGWILKTTQEGYDGKGQARAMQRDAIADAWKSLDHTSVIIEEMVDFTCEISVMVARNAQGETSCYDAAQNTHDAGILHLSHVPVSVEPSIAQEAQHIARRLADGLALVGIMGVEFFVQKDGSLLVNEIAPRPHNSGHWTMDGCATGQFEQTIRAITGLPFGATTRLCDVEMRNLIGDDIQQVTDYLNNPHAKLHLYGKAETRPGRKMGHVNLLQHKK